MTREQFKQIPEFQVLVEVARSKRHLHKNLEVQQAIKDLAESFPSGRRPLVQITLHEASGWPLFFQRYEMPEWVDAVADEVSQ